MVDIRAAFAAPRTPRMLGRVTFSDPLPRTPLVSKNSDINNRLYKLVKETLCGEEAVPMPCDTERRRLTLTPPQAWQSLGHSLALHFGQGLATSALLRSDKEISDCSSRAKKIVTSWS